MTTAQKIIKYLAISLAVFIIVSILSGIYYGVSTFSNFFDSGKIDSSLEKLTEFKIENNNISSLEIDVNAIKLTIKNGDYFNIRTNSKYIYYKQNKDELIVKEKKHSLFTKTDNRELIITIPDAIEFNDIEIDTGSGNVIIDRLSTQELVLNLGAGKVQINDLNVTKDTEIDGGAGEVKILSGTIKNLDLDMGVGKVEINCELLGNNKIDAGIGEIDLDLVGSLDNYKIKATKGIGDIVLNNESIKNDTYYGSGNNNLEIDGGIGKISIKLKEKEKNGF